MKTFDADVIMDDEDMEREFSNADVLTSDLLNQSNGSKLTTFLKILLFGAETTIISINKTVRKHPYESVAAAAILGLLIALLLTRSSSDD